MTVKELIEHLSKMPREAEVIRAKRGRPHVDYSNPFVLNEVKLVKVKPSSSVTERKFERFAEPWSAYPPERFTQEAVWLEFV